MKKILGALIIIASLSFTTTAFAYEFDFNFSQSRGDIVVIDGFNKVGKSRVDISDIASLIEENKKLKQEINNMSSKLNKLEDRVKELERKK